MKVFETTAEAEQGWTDIILSTWRDNERVHGRVHAVAAQLRGRPHACSTRAAARTAVGTATSSATRTCSPNGARSGDFAGLALEMQDAHEEARS